MVLLTFIITFASFCCTLCASDSTETKIDRTTIGGQWFLAYQNGERDNNLVNQFLLRRGYINVKHKFDKMFSARLTQDISMDKEGDGLGDVELRLKYCYLQTNLPEMPILYKPFIEFGLVHRPWLDFQQKTNYYRMQGTMFLERIKLMNSGGFGVTFMSFLGGEMDKEYKINVNSKYAGKYGSIAFGIYNGGGYHALENNLFKNFEGRITVRPLPYIIPGFQVSYLGIYGKGNIAQKPNFVVNNLMLSYETKYLVISGQYYFGRGNQSGSMINEHFKANNNMGYSGFAQLRYHEYHLAFFTRYDYFNNEDLDGIQTYRIISGISYEYEKSSMFLLSIDHFKDKFNSDRNDFIYEFGVEIDF